MNEIAESLQRQLDRLVDGELSSADIQMLRQQLECEPDGWRHCAKAVLDAQELRWSIRELAQRGFQPESCNGTRPAGRLLDSKSQALTRPADSNGSLATRTDDRPDTTKRFLGFGRALTALLIGLAFAAGWSWPRGGAQREAIHFGALHDDSPTQSPQDRPAADQQQGGSASGDRTANMNVGNEDKADTVLNDVALQRVSIQSQPVRGVSTDSGTAPVPDWMLAQLRNGGYQLNANRELIMIRLPSGQQVSVPLNSLSIKYVGETVY